MKQRFWTRSLDWVFGIQMQNHASNKQSKLSFLFTKCRKKQRFYVLFTKCSNAFKFYSQSEAMLLNTKPRLSIWYSNAKPRFKHATLLSHKVKPRLILYLRNHASNTQSKLSFLFTKWSNAFEREAAIDSLFARSRFKHAIEVNSQSEATLLEHEASIEYLVFKFETTLQTRNRS